MKIEDAIKELESYKERFGNIDINISRYKDEHTMFTYTRKLCLKDFYFSIGYYDTNYPVLTVQEIK